MTTVVSVNVDEDGSGEVEVLVGLDAEALSHLPDLDGSGASDEPDLMELVRADDLEAAGWEVTAPRTDGDTTWLRVAKPFGTPEEATSVLTELTGPDGALQDLEVSRDSSFGVDRFAFAGTADLSAGLETFSDEGLAAALDGEPLGESPTAIEERFERPLDEMYRLSVQLRLPGGGDESWEPELGGSPVAMETDSTVYNVPALALATVAALCLVALAGLVMMRLVRTR